MTKIDDVVQQTARALLRFRGETSSRALAEQLVRRYESLESDELDRFLGFLLTDMGAERDAIDAAIERYQETPGEAEVADLADAAESQRQHLFRAINTASGGIRTLLHMRTALLERRHSHPELAPVERDLRHLLTSWFNRGFLELRQLDWTTPAHVLEKLIEYEAVHEIRGWDDLRRRLAPDRRSFGFFHPALPGEPIIFVEVALTEGLASSIQGVIDAPAPDVQPEGADTAIFYSITNCQSGLRGVSFGSFLIKRVTELLMSEDPELTTFSTLSPIPGFASWLSEFHPDATIDDESDMLHLCAAYLLAARRDHMPLDPVARFHLRNGARIERINWRGDTSENGLQQSHGLLANYLYSGQDHAANHEALISDGLINASEEVIALAGDRVDATHVVNSAAEVAD
ncbi:MAG: malonyl-CoA decarboxylase [Acidimicrobiales bacterium]|nr:malonyl-CoA decarboxylase [Acidimicrobiales bacterium]RZV44742.1 MAG: hypothetical protein EX269_11200 [Acidimicrobiales bacterium]